MYLFINTVQAVRQKFWGSVLETTNLCEAACSDSSFKNNTRPFLLMLTFFFFNYSYYERSQYPVVSILTKFCVYRVLKANTMKYHILLCSTILIIRLYILLYLISRNQTGISNLSISWSLHCDFRNHFFI